MNIELNANKRDLMLYSIKRNLNYFIRYKESGALIKRIKMFLDFVVFLTFYSLSYRIFGNIESLLFNPAIKQYYSCCYLTISVGLSLRISRLRIPRL